MTISETVEKFKADFVSSYNSRKINQKIMVVMPPGTGKTRMIADLILTLKSHFNKKLVICPSSLQEQWNSVLQEKDIPSTMIHNSSSFLENLKSNRELTYIASVDLVKKPVFVKIINEFTWDLIVFDEAQVYIKNSLRSKLLTSLADTNNNVVLISNIADEKSNDQIIQHLNGFQVLKLRIEDLIESERNVERFNIELGRTDQEQKIWKFFMELRNKSAHGKLGTESRFDYLKYLLYIDRLQSSLYALRTTLQRTRIRDDKIISEEIIDLLDESLDYDSKFEELNILINEFEEYHIIVLSKYRDTLIYLKERLEDYGYEIYHFHNDITDRQHSDLTGEFDYDPKGVLLSTFRMADLIYPYDKIAVIYYDTHKDPACPNISRYSRLNAFANSKSKNAEIFLRYPEGSEGFSVLDSLIEGSNDLPPEVEDILEDLYD
ncbi:MAG: DEAD/DEAH box helicase family protein [Candidatus Heimdallarchaeota archaeon]|nr:DEAD/DEAH box helicase family protein [Candidatus Heimdallarchaeota archaeon]